MIYDKQEEKIKNYPRFLREYYFSDEKKRRKKMGEFYSVIPKNSIVLEGACGKISRLISNISDPSSIKMIVGIDLLYDSIKENESMDQKIIGNLENLPFKKGSFDVVNLPGVVEHLDNPEKVFGAASYVLKEGGLLLVGTKNIYNLFMSCNRLLPMKFRLWCKRIILKSPGHLLDTFPAPYRCNSSGKLKRVLADFGFIDEEIWLWGWPLIKTPAIGLFLSMIYEKLTDIPLLRFGKANIWARFRKL